MTDSVECPMLSVFVPIGETASCSRCGEVCTGPQLARKRRFGCKLIKHSGSRLPTPDSPLSSGIGTALAASFGRWWISAKTCSCKELEQRLNAMTVGQVREWTALPGLILENAQHLEGVSGKLIRSALKLPGGQTVAKKTIAWCIERAIQSATNPISGRGSDAAGVA